MYFPLDNSIHLNLIFSLHSEIVQTYQKVENEITDTYVPTTQLCQSLKFHFL